MKRKIAAALSILAVAAGVGWKLASHPATSTGLQAIALSQNSEHSQPDSTGVVARIRIRLSPDDVGYQSRATAHDVPHVALVAE